MKDREVMVVFPPCKLPPNERVRAKLLYDRAERAEFILIGNQLLFSNYVMSPGTIKPHHNLLLYEIRLSYKAH